MIDRERVVKGLKHCANDCAKTCPYFYTDECHAALASDVLALLKEQETADTGNCRVFKCEKCGCGINDIFVEDEEKYQIVPRYCPNCGRQVKLDEL